jgi:putative oxidoreductase
MYRTYPVLLNISFLLARCTIGVLLFMAGAGKLFGWFGGTGVAVSLEFYSGMGFSSPLAYMSMITEFLGGFLLTIGFLTRPAAFAVMINMAVATLLSLPAGFRGPMGAQIPFLYLVIDFMILLAGPMAYSLDRYIFREK